MKRKKILAKQVVDMLNDALENDYTAISSLFQVRVYCNSKTAEHESIQVFQTAKNSYIVGFLGLLNGMFGFKEGVIGMECTGTKIDGFVLLEDGGVHES